MLIDQIQNLTTPAKFLLTELHNALSDAIVIPNSCLPTQLHGKRWENEGSRRYGRTVSELMATPKLTERELKRLADEERDIEKSLRVESYSADIASDRELQYHEDEERLYRNQVTFANLIGLEFEE